MKHLIWSITVLLTVTTLCITAVRLADRGPIAVDVTLTLDIAQHLLKKAP